MSNKNIFKERERGLENELIIKKEQELVEKMRHRRALEKDRRQMAEETGVADQEVLGLLQDLGFSADTVKLMPIIPLIQVAWAENGVSKKEREMILEIAAARDIKPGVAAYEELIDLLEQEPPQEFYDRALRGLRYLLEAIPEDLREEGQQSLVEYSTQIADVSGGILGFGRISDEERQLIAQIATEIGQTRPAAVKKVIED